MPLQLLITMEDSGQVRVDGPIGNKVLCFGLLEIAKEAVREYAEKNQKLVVPVSGMTVVPNGRG
jgi:hypothetical protein